MIDLERPGKTRNLVYEVIHRCTNLRTLCCEIGRGRRCPGAIAFVRIPQATKYFSENHETKEKRIHYARIRFQMRSDGLDAWSLLPGRSSPGADLVDHLDRFDWTINVCVLYVHTYFGATV